MRLKEVASDEASPLPLERNLIERVCVGDIVRRAADQFGPRVAVIDGDRHTTYAELDALIDRLGRCLLQLGLPHQAVVAVASRNRLELVLTYFACARAGLVCMPLNLGLLPDEMAYCLSDAQATVLVTERALRANIEAALSQVGDSVRHVFWFGEGGHAKEADFDLWLRTEPPAPLEVLVADRDVVQLLYTSGTTSRPKGVLTSHLAVTLAALSNALAHRAGPEQVALLCLPLFHCAMLNSVLMPTLLVGGTAVLMTAFEPEQAAGLVERHTVTFLLLLPTMYGQWLSHPRLQGHTYPSVRRATYAMAPMGSERLQAIHDLFPQADVVLGSGQTEFTPAICLQRNEHQRSKAPSWGSPTAMTRVAIMDSDGHLLPRGQTGELVYRGPQVMNGYLHQPQASAESLRHGWFHSGDVAHIDDEGVIWFTDRFKDVIKSGGENVASLEVERCLLEHPSVAEAAVVGVPHPHWGEAVVACVISAPGQTAHESDLLDWCRERLGGFKVPKAVLTVASYPRTGTGKVQKHLLRQNLRHLFDGHGPSLDSGTARLDSGQQR